MRRQSQPEPGRAGKLLKRVKSALPGGAAQTTRRRDSLPIVGGMSKGKKRASGGRGRTSAMVGVLGAGAAGAAALVARRRKDSGPQANETPLSAEPQASNESQATDAPDAVPSPSPSLSNEPPAADDPASGSDR